MRKASLVILLASGLAQVAVAGETAAFLKVGVGARALGMGGAHTAIANDVNAMGWNPGGLAGLSKRELGIMDAELSNDVRLDFLGYAQPLSYGTLGVGALRLSQGTIESRDASGKLNGSFTAADTALNVSYGARLWSGAQLGGNVKVIQSQIANASAQTYAVDVGGMQQLARRGLGVPIVAFAVQNLGPGMKFLDQTSQLPLTAALGLGYRLPAGLTLAVDYKHRPYSHTSEISVGTEYSLFSNFALRGGYGSAQSGGTAATSARGAAALNGVAMGFGVKVYGYSLDYAITPFGELGNVQRFSLGARF